MRNSVELLDEKTQLKNRAAELISNAKREMIVTLYTFWISSVNAARDDFGYKHSCAVHMMKDEEFSRRWRVRHADRADKGAAQAAGRGLVGNCVGSDDVDGVSAYIGCRRGRSGGRAPSRRRAHDEGRDV